jgi:PEP-CTERM putative exosortase interaction domain
MKPIYRTLAIALTLGSLGMVDAYAQATGAGANPASRGPRDSFFYGPLNGKPTEGVLSNGTGNDLIKRPKGNGAVTPVPEPSEWAMMLAGLALVGVIVKRRNNAR